MMSNQSPKQSLFMTQFYAGPNTLSPVASRRSLPQVWNAWGRGKKAASPGRPGEARKHLHDADDRHSPFEVGDFAQRPARMKEYERGAAFHCAAQRVAVMTAFVWMGHPSCALGDVEDDTVAGAKELVAL